MSELRWNPLLKTWTMVGANRQKRPHLPKGWCAFCPGSGRVPDDYDVMIYDNDFPIMMPEPPEPDDVAGDIYRTAPAAGKCEVVLYSPKHDAHLSSLGASHIRKVVDLWAERCEALAEDERVKYVFPFENRGEEVGVTMHHPHGQIYAYSYVPLKLELELAACREHRESHGDCLICRMNAEERRFDRRIVFENDSFSAYLPFFTDYPYGVFIVSKRHVGGLTDLTAPERDDLAACLEMTVASFDKVFDRPFPYMMAVHQTPVNSPELGDVDKYFHFHIEFYPPLRAADKIKYYASSEMGAWAAANVAAVEDSVMTLRRAKLDALAEGDEARYARELATELERQFGPGAKAEVFAAPARVNLIGEHIDYSGGLVFPAALDRFVGMAIRLRDDDKIIGRNFNFPEVFEGSVAEAQKRDARCPWSDYLRGVLEVLRQQGHRIDRGFELLLHSTVPAGGGVSSSAALEVVFGYAMSEMFGLGLSNKEIALVGQKAENEFVGVSCGIMDQYAVAMGRENRAVLLDCAALEHELVPLDLDPYRVVIVNTNKSRRLEESKYNERLAECRQGLEALRRKIPDLANLCELTPAQLEEHAAVLDGADVGRRVRHAVTENARVKDAAEALRAGDITRLGELMAASHISLRGDYEVTGKELDSIFERSRTAPGCIGARMTGAGFGGCAVALVHRDKLGEYRDAVAEGYRQDTGLEASFYICRVGDGVRRLG